MLESFSVSNKDLAQELSLKSSSLKEQEHTFSSIKNKHAEQNNYVLSLESKLTEKEKALIKLQNEYSEFKRQIKESFSTQLVEKVNAYRKSKEVMCAYAEEMRNQNDELSKEVNLWQTCLLYTSPSPRDS